MAEVNIGKEGRARVCQRFGVWHTSRGHGVTIFIRVCGLFWASSPQSGDFVHVG